MRRDKDCPYRSHCHDAPGGCENCDWHLAFEKFRRRVTRMENRLSRMKAILEMYRGVEGSRLNEMMDAELQGRCLTIPACNLEDIEDFGELYKEFMDMLRANPPTDSVMGIGEAVEKFLEDMEQKTRLCNAKSKEVI